MTALSAPLVRILLATRNGGGHLRAQLDSYLAQDHDAWALWVSDDGSRDDTWAQLEAFRSEHPNREIRLLRGPKRGAAANFLSLLTHPELPPGPVALSDQDDVWMPHRLSRGLAHVRGPAPALYGSVTLETDADLRPLNRQKLRLPPPSFRNALVQNIVAGNTITLNAPGLAALRAAGAPNVPFHDWWIYLRLAGVGARITLDDEPVLYYRQHAGNVIGAHSGPRATMHRLTSLVNGTYRSWVQRNLTALLAAPHGLLPDHAAAARMFLETRRRNQAVTLSGARRSSRAGQTVLRALAATRRV